LASGPSRPLLSASAPCSSRLVRPGVAGLGRLLLQANQRAMGSGVLPLLADTPSSPNLVRSERQGTVKCAQALLSSSAATPDVK